MEYMTSRNGVAEVRCKGTCTAVTVIHGKPTAVYTELVIEMREANGLLSKHETGVCIGCKMRILRDGPRLGELIAIFEQDVEQWIANAHRAGMRPMEIDRLVFEQRRRVPIRALHERGRGEAAV